MADLSSISNWSSVPENRVWQTFSFLVFLKTLLGKLAPQILSKGQGFMDQVRLKGFHPRKLLQLIFNFSWIVSKKRNLCIRFGFKRTLLEKHWFCDKNGLKLSGFTKVYKNGNPLFKSFFLPVSWQCTVWKSILL